LADCDEGADGSACPIPQVQQHLIYDASAYFGPGGGSQFEGYPLPSFRPVAPPDRLPQVHQLALTCQEIGLV
jgi:hypothetical protein